MSSNLNTLLHGSAAEAAEILGGDYPPDDVGAIQSIRAALTNALNRIDTLEKKLAVPAPIRRCYVVKTEEVGGGVTNELDNDVVGSYRFTTISEEAALDEFHSTVPIKVLDDFEISVRARPAIGPGAWCPDCAEEYSSRDIGQTCGTCHRGMICEA